MSKHVSRYVSPLDRALASKDPQLLKTNIANICGHTLKGRPVETINRAIEAVHDLVLSMMERNKNNGKNNGPYIYRAIQNEAIRFVMNPANRQGKEVHGWQVGHMPDVQKHKATVAEWLANAKDDKERELLTTLHGTAHALTYTRRRYAELRQSAKRLVDHCAKGAGVGSDDALPCSPKG
jgi:hypothetical protein